MHARGNSYMHGVTALASLPYENSLKGFTV